MGKEGELWDDSALINAFDDAMSKYKRMHGKKSQSKPSDEGRVVSGNGKDISVVDDETHGTTREADEDNNIAPNIASEAKEAENLAAVKDSVCVESSPGTSHGPQVQTVNGYSNSQGIEDYNQLLGQYYELEEKRQKILEQLQQFGGYYQYPAEGSGVPWGSCSTSQDYSVPANQTSILPTENYSCCPCASYCSLPPCPSNAACALSGTCVGKPIIDSSAAVGPRNSFTRSDEDIVKTAMGAAEKAISSLKKKVSADTGSEEERGKNGEGEMDQSTSSETDLSDVLNAWYAAGFHTGKYLTEQSIAKKRNG